MKKNLIFAFLISAIVSAFAVSSSAQLKTGKPVKKTATKKIQPAAPETQSAEPVPSKTPVKKNERPEAPTTDAENSAPATEPHKKNQVRNAATAAKGAAEQFQNIYTYEFSQPNFFISRVRIEHDETGRGRITFEKKNFGEPVTDPLQLSGASLEKIKNLFQTLNFADSTEDYQSTLRNYGHLGTVKISYKKDGQTRAAEYNWTENKDAKALSDEYRKIGEQFVWIFDVSVARENQPLEAPGLMDALDSLLRRDEISDPAQLVPLLKKLSDDERIPLIARNHAARIVKEIEKKEKGK